MKRSVEKSRADRTPPSAAEIQQVLGQAMSRESVILVARPEMPERLDHIEREAVVVVPKGAWIQICIWLAAWSSSDEA